MLLAYVLNTSSHTEDGIKNALMASGLISIKDNNSLNKISPEIQKNYKPVFSAARKVSR